MKHISHLEKYFTRRFRTALVFRNGLYFGTSKSVAISSASKKKKEQQWAPIVFVCGIKIRKAKYINVNH